jgi:hypothetical protein
VRNVVRANSSVLTSANGSLSGVAAVRRVIGTLTLVLCLSGCQAAVGEPVDLLTGVEPNSCFAGGETGTTGPLVVDPKYGTSLNGKPVMWPVGFTARRVGGEVKVLDGAGNVRATTGRLYHISIAPVWSDDKQRLLESVGAYPAAANCDYPWDFIDCTAAPADMYCRTD